MSISYLSKEKERERDIIFHSPRNISLSSSPPFIEFHRGPFLSLLSNILHKRLHFNLSRYSRLTSFLLILSFIKFLPFPPSILFAHFHLHIYIYLDIYISSLSDDFFFYARRLTSRSFFKNFSSPTFQFRLVAISKTGDFNRWCQKLIVNVRDSQCDTPLTHR